MKFKVEGYNFSQKGVIAFRNKESSSHTHIIPALRSTGVIPTEYLATVREKGNSKN